VHELSIATAVISTAVKHADGRPVTAVGVRAGRLRQVVPESLRFYFAIVARDSPCEGARLELVETEAWLRCEECGNEWEPDWALFRCPQCDAANVQVTSGDELLVEYIEVDDKEPACIGPR
jgi:hydrogenase nickel incorporation protein HypA/HybF